MGVLEQALAKLAAVNVAGVTSYALGETPERLTRAQLPALVILPDAARESGAQGAQPNAFSAGDARLQVQVVHTLLSAPVAQGLGRRSAWAALIPLVDGYVEALAADALLGGALPVPLRFTVRMGVVRYGGVDYWGAVFRHVWTLHVG